MRAEAFFDPDEAAQELAVTRRWVYTLLRTGRLRGHQKGQLWRIRPADLRRFQKQWARRRRSGTG